MVQFQMPYHHIFIAFKDKTVGMGLLFNFFEEDLRKSIASPYMENKPLLIAGKFYQSSDIDRIAIFKSQEPYQQLILPNGKSPVDENIDYIYNCFSLRKVKGHISYCTHDFITSPPREKEEPFIELMKSASFLGLDTNWSAACSALQMQEIAVILVAERKGIRLDKTNVERILNEQIEELSFNDRYNAFCKEVKSLFNIEMPILTGHLRKMRTQVLHQGYNPKSEETNSIISFTIGLLQRLESISGAT